MSGQWLQILLPYRKVVAAELLHCELTATSWVARRRTFLGADCAHGWRANQPLDALRSLTHGSDQNVVNDHMPLSRSCATTTTSDERCFGDPTVVAHWPSHFQTQRAAIFYRSVCACWNGHWNGSLMQGTVGLSANIKIVATTQNTQSRRNSSGVQSLLTPQIWLFVSPNLFLQWHSLTLLPQRSMLWARRFVLG